MFPSVIYLCVDIATVAAATAEDRYVALPEGSGEWELVYAAYVPATTDALDASNYTTITLKNGSNALGTLSNETVAFTAGTLREFDVTGNGQNAEFTGGTDDLNINKAETGTGGVLDGAISLKFVRRT